MSSRRWWEGLISNKIQKLRTKLQKRPVERILCGIIRGGYDLNNDSLFVIERSLWRDIKETCYRIEFGTAMDGSNFATSAMRYDHLQRILKHYELEALNSLRGPATLNASSPGTTTGSGSGLLPCQPQQSQTQGNVPGSSTMAEVEKASLSSLFNTAATLYRPTANKTLDAGSLTSNMAAAAVRRSESGGGEVGCGGERFVAAVDRSVLQQQETLLKEILAMRGAVPVQSFPVLTSQDRTSSSAERRETLLEGEIITCFNVGGEKRLCLPQVLNTVLRNISMVDINRACTELNIHCGHCTPEQLLVLKIAGVVSATTASCALITKTDAERLCDYLLRQRRTEQFRHGPVSSSRPDTKQRMVIPVVSQNQRSSNVGSISEALKLPVSSSSSRRSVWDAKEIKSENGIGVIHFCFGRCRGRYKPLLYPSPSAECIECEECGQQFAPDRFVVHSHGNQERRTCHWGFDSANWRAYLHLTDDDESEENQKILDEMKLRFDVTGLTKRKLHQDADSVVAEKVNSNMEELKLPTKRPRIDTAAEQRQVPNVDSTSGQLPQESKMTAAPAATPALSGSILPNIEPAALPYLLCDPLLLTAYYQAALAAATATIRAATATSTAAAMSIPPSMLPPLTSAPTLQTTPSKLQLPSSISGSNTYLDGFGLKMGPVQPYQTEAQRLTTERPLLDEATAAAALRLLQLHAGETGDYGCGKLGSTPPYGKGIDCRLDMGKESAANQQRNALMESGKLCNIQQTASAFGKEPFKKQLLHLFTAEQQQKEELRRQQHQQQQQSEPPKRSDLNQRRGSVEIIVDDDEHKTTVAQRQHQSMSSSESERQEACQAGEVATPDTQVADELSISSSDNESANGDLSLDEILRRYIFDADGLKIVRAKIAENQQYLEQKLDAVSAENRILHAECLQLRTKQIQDQRQRQETGMLGKSVIGNFMDMLPKHFTM